MQEFNLENIWQADIERSQQFYQLVEPQLLSLAREKSTHILNKIERNLFVEFIVSVLFWAGVLFLFSTKANFVYFVLFAIFVWGITAYFYWQQYQKLKFINLQNIKASISTTLAVLKNTYRRMKIFLYFLLPAGYVFGFLFGIFQIGSLMRRLENWMIVAPIILFSIVVLILFMWFVNRKYLHQMYGKHIEDLQELHEHLVMAK